MFYGFNLVEADKEGRLDCYESAGNEYFERYSGQLKNFSDTFNKYVRKGCLDGDIIQEEWFPSIEADVFISHSHDDKPLALKLAGFLHKEFGLQPFVDSFIWGYAENLLNGLVEKYGDSMRGCYYGYKGNREKNSSCNRMKRYASHVHMMLTTALVGMMDKCECLFFLNTQKSCNASQLNQMESTVSPWIYMEMSLSRTIRRKDLICERYQYIRQGQRAQTYMQESAGQVDIAHRLQLNHLDTITPGGLLQWLATNRKYEINQSHQKRFPLDDLYRQTDALRKLEAWKQKRQNI